MNRRAILLKLVKAVGVHQRLLDSHFQFAAFLVRGRRCSWLNTYVRKESVRWGQSLRVPLPPREVPTLTNELLDYFWKGIEGFGPFWARMLGYWKESLERPDKVLLRKYEELEEYAVGNLLGRSRTSSWKFHSHTGK